MIDALSFRCVGPALLLLMLGSAGCVPATEHKEVISALLAEQAAHRKTEERARALQQKLEALEKSYDEKERALREQELVIAQSRFDTRVVDKEREAATQLVEQMRNELARVADNLRLYSSQKQELEKELEAALERAQKLVQAENRASMNAALIRDFALLLPSTLASGATQLKLVEGRPQLRADSSELTSGKGDRLSERGDAIVAATAKLLERYPEVHLQLGAEPRTDSSSAALRLIEAKLLETGVARQRLRAEVPSTDGATNGSTPEFTVTWTFIVPE